MSVQQANFEKENDINIDNNKIYDILVLADFKLVLV